MKVTSRDPEERKIIKRRNTIKLIATIILVLTIIWAGFTVYEYTRVLHGSNTLLCLNKTEDTENNDEYSITCYGIFYKSRTYYNSSNDNVNGRAFAMFFSDFRREE